METLQNITQEIIAQVEGGVFTDETKFEETFVDSIVHQVRADLFRQNQSNIMSNQWQQSYFPEYVETMQETGDCFVRFYAPASILTKDGGDMTSYVGPASGKVGYTRLGLYGSISVDLAHPITNPFKKGVAGYVLEYADTGQMQVKIYGNIDIQSFRMDFVHYNPTDNPSYRRSTDLYPISGELLVSLKAGVMNKLMGQMAARPSDSLSNSQDNTNEISPQVKPR